MATAQGWAESEGRRFLEANGMLPCPKCPTCKATLAQATALLLQAERRGAEAMRERAAHKAECYPPIAAAIRSLPAGGSGGR